MMMRMTTILKIENKNESSIKDLYTSITNDIVECKKAQPKEVMMPNNVARGRGAGRGAYDLVWPLGALTDGFPAAYASYAGRGGYPGYPGFGYPFAESDSLLRLLIKCMPNQQSASATDLLCVELNGQQTSPPLLTQALSVINNYGATAGAPNFGSSSPGTAANGSTRGFPSTSSPGPTLELYSSSQDSVAGYVQATSPQPASAFPQIAVSRR
ncbi:RNA-binding protein Musashi Rbp6-like protein [Dinothrombium tinctorium]|uniref:RNA-binding protein Musashi Rbp6-like protein n=1 Tax=Dinothrombium tinctorium TaxID=1965070 RepID=A0A443RRU2_9ACAR|nr:RNA-binding protein Musashi Rbp6-like protein [Dinothrombium tinctorium]